MLNPTTSNEPNAPVNPTLPDDLHADKSNPPQGRITRRGIAYAVGVMVFACLMTWGTIRARRTQLKETTAFYGASTIMALQLADVVHILPGANQSPDADQWFEPVELTGMPGLGHLRHALLHSPHYQWDTQVEGSIDEITDDESFHVILRFADPTGERVAVTMIPLELSKGWIGSSDGTKRVQVIERVQSALEHQVKLFMNFTQQQYDERQ